MIKRRDFITLLGCAAVAWPFAARAQQSGRLRRIGALMGFAESDPEQRARTAAFLNRLQELGWTDLRVKPVAQNEQIFSGFPPDSGS